MNHAPPGGEMNAQQQTRTMLDWWQRLGITRMDMAIRRPDGVMMWRQELLLSCRELAWARSCNADGSDIYVRPSRSHAWPVVFLDDVNPAMAIRVSKKYRALIVRSSTEGGCHVWLACTRPLPESKRKTAQRWLAGRIGADRASTSGEHLGRLAGFKNWKREGQWVNVLALSDDRARWCPITDERAAVASQERHLRTGLPRQATRASHNGDQSQSAKEWGWVCGSLEAGADPDWICGQLTKQAYKRRGADADRYARLTIRRAIIAVESKMREQ